MQHLLNVSGESDFEELLFWGKLSGLSADYYVALGLVYTGRYEFPSKRFYYCLSTDFLFKPFPALNDQHKDLYDSLNSMLTGNPNLIHKKVEPERSADAQDAEDSPSKKA